MALASIYYCCIEFNFSRTSAGISCWIIKFTLFVNSPACRSYIIFSHFNLSVRIFYLVKFYPACGSLYRISVSDNSLSRDGNIIRISPPYTRLYTFWHLYIADSARIKWLCCWYSWHCIRLNNNGTIVASVLHASSRTLHWRYQRPPPSTLTPLYIHTSCVLQCSHVVFDLWTVPILWREQHSEVMDNDTTG